MEIIQSMIKSVTVFNDRALVIRNSKSKLNKGISSLTFDNLPSNIDRNSIQINGYGNATILDVTTKEIEYLNIAQKEISELQNKKIELADKIEELLDNENEVDSEKETIAKIINKLTSYNKQTETLAINLLEPEKWKPLIEFNRAKQKELNSEIRKITKEKKRLTDEAEHIENELRKLNQNQYKSAFQVEVKIEAEKEEQIELELSYVVIGPSWKPLYDIRVDSESKTVKITYKASVFQNTTEAWSDVKLILSTAQPHIQTEQKELTPLYIDLKSVQSGYETISDEELRKMYKNQLREGNISSKGGAGLGLLDDERNRRREIKKNIASIENNKTSVEFIPHGNYSIKNNNEAHEVTILISEFQSKLYYSTIPKIKQAAHLKVEILNNTEYPLLKGTANIFLDNAFVANSRINRITPNEKLFISLGIDQSIKIEYKFINKFFKNEGFVNKRKKQYFEYEITVTNNKKTDEIVIVQDQLPISNHEDIKVELIEPSLKDAKHRFKKKEHEVLKWTLDLQTKEKIKIPLQYSIEYPKNDEFIYK